MFPLWKCAVGSMLSDAQFEREVLELLPSCAVRLRELPCVPFRFPFLSKRLTGLFSRFMTLVQIGSLVRVAVGFQSFKGN